MDASFSNSPPRGVAAAGTGEVRRSDEWAHRQMAVTRRSASRCQVAIIGAGPYGLAAVAHLWAAQIEARIFGESMVFWQRQMPAGMLLRSSWDASHISDPHRALTLDRYQETTATKLSMPVPVEGFIEYGKWFQRRVAPDLDRRRVAQVEPVSSGFRLEVEDGEQVQVQRVVIAAGIALFAWRPALFDALPPSLASHSSDHNDLSRFAGRRVVVVGGGQSALESAALLHEHGAEVEVIMRAPQVRWIRHDSWLRRQPKPFRWLFYPPTDVGPPGLNWMVAVPDLFRRLPFDLQMRIAFRSIRPAASGWLRPRLNGVPITTGRKVDAATPHRGALRLALDDGTERLVDHALLATGFRVDVARYPFLGPRLLGSLRRVDGYPELGAGFESSVPGLHFLGASAARSFGPLLRFVSGSGYAARALTRHILAQSCGR